MDDGGKNMNTKDDERRLLLVIGNGYDLYLKAKTSYADYFNSKKKLFIKLKEACKSIRNNFFDSDTEEYIKESCYDKTFTFWDWVFFLTSNTNDINDMNNVRWCDIEQTLHSLLVKNDESHGQESINLEGLFDYFNKGNDINLLNYLRNNSKILQPIDYCHMSIFFDEDRHGTFTDEKVFYKYLLEKLKIFEIEFGKFIFQETKEKSCNLLPHDLSLGDIKPYGRIVSVSTFNYSEICNSESRDIIPFNHINGDYNHPIFGIDSKNIEPSSPIYIFTKTSRRMEYELRGFSSYTEIDYDDIVIFGHSLNEQDYSYFFSLFDQIELSNARCSKKVVFAYNIYDPYKENEIIDKQRQAIASLISKYDEYLGNHTEKRLLDFLTINHKIRLINIDKLLLF